MLKQNFFNLISQYKNWSREESTCIFFIYFFFVHNSSDPKCPRFIMPADKLLAVHHVHKRKKCLDVSYVLRVSCDFWKFATNFSDGLTPTWPVVKAFSTITKENKKFFETSALKLQLIVLRLNSKLIINYLDYIVGSFLNKYLDIKVVLLFFLITFNYAVLSMFFLTKWLLFKSSTKSTKTQFKSWTFSVQYKNWSRDESTHIFCFHFNIFRQSWSENVDSF